MVKQVEIERQEITAYIRAELEFCERMIQQHRASGHHVAIDLREKHGEKLRRWLAWLER